MPEVGKKKIFKVDKVIKTGAFLSHEEDDKNYFLHVTEVSDEWVNSMFDIVKVGESLECRVIGVRNVKGRDSYQLSLKDGAEVEVEKEDFNKKLDNFIKSSAERQDAIRKSNERKRNNGRRYRKKRKE